MSGRAEVSAIVWTPVPGIANAMPSRPLRAFAEAIAARSVQAPAAVAQMPSVVLASGSSAIELTVNVTSPGRRAASCGAPRPTMGPATGALSGGTVTRTGRV